ncbi:MAG: tyrosine--tRNA ligase [Phycisphaerales bacterium]|nr:tyrosine--tRNA ligase [Phycisphaerales bacterium]
MSPSLLPPSPAPTDFIPELNRRGLFHQATDEAGLSAHLSGARRRFYVGFDPTADSLTIGNLVPIILLRHAQLAGHQPVVVMGGGTGYIGDPSGKSAERELMSPEKIEANVNSQRRIFGRVLDCSASSPNAAIIVNNYDWLSKISYLEALRDIGKHFSVNMMIQKDSVRDRLHTRDQGISYTEFSYMLLQAYDFLHLYKQQGVTVQMGGSDQWGNILGGVDLIRRVEYWEPMNAQAAINRAQEGVAPGQPIGVAEVESGKAFALTAPLVTKSDGGKFGKSESGAVWLTAERTSPYAFYQFWLNSADDDAVRWLKFFTFLTVEAADEVIAAHTADPAARAAQRALARHMTELLHGTDEMQHAEAAAAALFSGQISTLPERTLLDALEGAPTTTHPKAALEGEGLSLLDLLPQTQSLAKSKTEARKLLAEGSVSINGSKASADHRLTTTDLLHGSIIALRRGKKAWHVTRWE